MYLSPTLLIEALSFCLSGLTEVNELFHLINYFVKDNADSAV